MLKLFEMFAGYGGASFALDKAAIDFECVGYSEIDKYAIQCYEQNHYDVAIEAGEILPQEYLQMEHKNYGDCTKIDPEELPDFDLLTGGFPCPTFSLAGKGKGEEDPRGKLFHEIVRIAEAKQPKYMLLENVKGLVTEPHKDTFEKILKELDRIGYLVHTRVLNSKQYGIPQSRDRVWFMCIRRDFANEWAHFRWPKKNKLELFLKDIMEKEVDEKYYLSKKAIEGITKSNYHDRKPQMKDICATLKCGGDIKCIPGPFIVASRGRNPLDPSDRSKGSKMEQRLEPRTDGTTNCILPTQKDNFLVQDSKIRRLTPTEYFRLMGFLDDEINLDGLSDTQRYKLAGNGWDINLVSKIFKEMFKSKKESK